jgi:hypothetical protein
MAGQINAESIFVPLIQSLARSEPSAEAIILKKHDVSLCMSGNEVIARHHDFCLSPEHSELVGLV